MTLHDGKISKGNTMKGKWHCKVAKSEWKILWKDLESWLHCKILFPQWDDHTARKQHHKKPKVKKSMHWWKVKLIEIIYDGRDSNFMFSSQVLKNVTKSKNVPGQNRTQTGNNNRCNPMWVIIEIYNIHPFYLSLIVFQIFEITRSHWKWFLL